MVQGICFAAGISTVTIIVEENKITEGTNVIKKQTNNSTICV